MYKPDSRAKVPEPQRSVPRSRKSKLSIAANHHIGNKVIMSMETVLGYTIVGLITSQIPNDDRLILKREKCQEIGLEALKLFTHTHSSDMVTNSTQVMPTHCALSWGKP